MRTVIKDKYIKVVNGNLNVVLSCLGASIVEIKYDDDLMTLTPVNYEDLNREDIYYGKTIGPIANRIKDGLVVIDNKNYYLPLNEKGVCNHSGKVGLSNKIFNVSVEDGRVIFIYKDFICSKDFSKLPLPTEAKGDTTSQVTAGVPLKLHTSSTAPL